MPDKLLRLDPKAKAAIEELQMPGEPDIYMHLIEVFLATTHEYLDLMKAKSDDIHAVRAAAHSMRSASLSIGAQILGDICLRVEAERSIINIKSLINDVEREFLELKAELFRNKAA